MKYYDTIIVGGGPSGMAAAIQCSGKNQRVLLIDRCDKIGKKILVTGNGKCNLTNMRQQSVCYRGNAPDRIRSIFSVFGLKDTFDLFHSLGLYTREKNGYVYPYSEQASSVREAFESKLLSTNHLKVMTSASVNRIEKNKKGFTVSVQSYPKQEKILGNFSCTSLIITTGGLAGIKLGCDGSGYQFARQFGHHIVKPLPALTALKSAAPFLKKMSGVRNQAKIVLYIEDKVAAEETGELQWTNYGISGVAIFQVSRHAVLALEEGKKVGLSIDFMPEYSWQETEKLIKNMMRQCSYKNGEEFLNGWMPMKISPILLKEAKISSDKKVNQWTQEEIKNIVRAIKTFSLRIQGYVGYEKAQVTRGGISLEELSEGLESRFCSGLFFAGEVVDVDGICGGYNLQWAFSSGSVAGRSAFIRNRKKSRGMEEQEC